MAEKEKTKGTRKNTPGGLTGSKLKNQSMRRTRVKNQKRRNRGIK